MTAARKVVINIAYMYIFSLSQKTSKITQSPLMSQPHIVLQKKSTAINELYASMIFILTSLTLWATVRNNDGVS